MAMANTTVCQMKTTMNKHKRREMMLSISAFTCSGKRSVNTSTLIC